MIGTVSRAKSAPRAEAPLPRWVEALASVTMSLYVIILYFRSALQFTLPPAFLESSNLVLLTSLAGLLIWPWNQVVRVKLAEVAVLGAALMIVSISSSEVQVQSGAYTSAMRDVAGVWLSYVASRIIASGISGRFRLAAVLVLCAAANASVGLWGSITGRSMFDVGARDVGIGTMGFDKTSGRSGGVVGENYVGVFDVPALVAGLGLMTAGWRWVGSPLAMVAAAGIASSLSRASALAAIVAVGTFLLAARGRARLRRMSALGLAAVAGTLLLQPLVVEQLARTGSESARAVAARWTLEGIAGDSRQDLWRFYWNMFQQRPLFGGGPGVLGDTLSRNVLLPHNSLLDIAVSYGTVGLAVFVVALSAPVFAWRRGRRKETTEELFEAMCLASYAGMFAALLTLSSPFLRVVWIVGGLLAGAAGGGESTRRSGRARRREWAGFRAVPPGVPIKPHRTTPRSRLRPRGA